VRSINPQADEVVVEIGPGWRADAALHANGLGQLHVVESIATWWPHLHAVCGERRGCSCICHALKFDYGSLVVPAAAKAGGNLPYNISTPLLFSSAAVRAAGTRHAFWLQKEVVDRLTAGPTPTITAPHRHRGRGRRPIICSASVPAPSSTASGGFRVVRITPRPAPFAIDNLRCYDELVTASFSQRRKTLANGLRKLLPPEENRAAGIDPRCARDLVTAAVCAAGQSLPGTAKPVLEASLEKPFRQYGVRKKRTKNQGPRSQVARVFVLPAIACS